jgi:NAD(P)-dependent dehydrogenase (short-subunit alcohol dehydrogenase family)
MTDIQGKTVLITGASRGIGAAAAREFADLGANVVLLARSSAEINDLAREIGSLALPITCDVSRYGDVETAMHTALAKFGTLDVVINNAGVIEPIAPLATSDPDGWSKAIDINLKGVYYGMRAAIPLMKKAGGGTIITISSGAARNAMEGWSQYCAAKAGAAMLTMSAHKEESGNGIRVMGLSPGTVATEMQREIKASGINPVSTLDWSAHIPPEWVSKALVWMCLADSDKFLGQEVSLRDETIRRTLGLIE